jgi:hypothetical protein
VILEARLTELDALLREAVARMRRQEDSAAAGPLALGLVGTLTDTVRELGENCGRAVLGAPAPRGIAGGAHGGSRGDADGVRAAQGGRPG